MMSIDNSWFNNKSEEIIQTLIGQSQQDQWEIRNSLAEEGQVFYDNTLTNHINWKKYFPENRFTNNTDLISLPITKQILSKIISSFRVSVDIETSEQKYILELYKKYKIDNIIKKNILNSLINGYSSIWLSRNNNNNINIDTWRAWFTTKQYDKTGRYTEGYIKNYISNDGIIQSPDIKKTKNTIEWIDYVNDTTWTQWCNDKVVYAEPHGLPFIPVVWFNAIDEDEDDRYGIPFHMRFRKLLINLNQLYSASQRMLLTTPVVWTTTKDFVDNNNLLSIRPDIINYVGSDKELKQTTRELDLTFETLFCDKYLEQIYEVSQLPPKEFLEGSAKVESGVALKIVYHQFQCMLDDMAKTYSDKEEELVKKIYYIETGKELNNIEITYNNSGIPTDEKQQWELNKAKLDAGVITFDELNLLY